MLVIINDSPKDHSRHVRAIIGRYLWKVGRDIWVWSDASMRFQVIQEISKYDRDIRVVIIWKCSQEIMGFAVEFVGNMVPLRTENGLFQHLEARREVLEKRKKAKHPHSGNEIKDIILDY